MLVCVLNVNVDLAHLIIRTDNDTVRLLLNIYICLFSSLNSILTDNYFKLIMYLYKIPICAYSYG